MLKMIFECLLSCDVCNDLMYALYIYLCLMSVPKSIVVTGMYSLTFAENCVIWLMLIFSRSQATLIVCSGL